MKVSIVSLFANCLVRVKFKCVNMAHIIKFVWHPWLGSNTFSNHQQIFAETKRICWCIYNGTSD